MTTGRRRLGGLLVHRLDTGDSWSGSECLAVDLARGGARQFGENVDGRRAHGRGQVVGEPGAQSARRGARRSGGEQRDVNLGRRIDRFLVAGYTETGPAADELIER